MNERFVGALRSSDNSAIKRAPAEIIRFAEWRLTNRLRANERDGDGFNPHGYLCGTDASPSSIFIYAVTGGADRWLKFDLIGIRQEADCVLQAVEIAKAFPIVPFHGRLTGFVINYSKTCAVRFDTVGTPVAELNSSYRPGSSYAVIDGQKVGWSFF